MEFEPQLPHLLDGRYELLEPLGTGGMGVVYRARRINLGDDVAIKVIHPHLDSKQARARFLREAQAAAHIRHPNVVQIFDFGGGRERQLPYLVMELLSGPDLSAEIQKLGRIPVARAVRLFTQVCAAVEAGHRRGVLHRDLKPRNVVLADSDDGREIPKVLDFGVASFDTPEGPGAMTSPGSLLGTCSYIAPEVIMGAPASAASDVFALGVVLYEMVTGRLPFEGASPIATMIAIRSASYRDPRELAHDLPEVVTAAIAAALIKEPEDRVGSAAALATMLGADLTAVHETKRRAPKPVTPLEPPTPREAAVHTDASLASMSQTWDLGPGSTRQETGSKLYLPTPPQAQVRPQLHHFAGREVELARLEDELNAARSGRGRITIVTGDAGLGKTFLLERFRENAQAAGARVLSGRFFEYEGSRLPPCETFRLMLAMPSIPGDASRLAETKEFDAAPDRLQVFASLADRFRSFAATGPLVLVLEDLQWAGRLDLDALAFLQRQLQEDGVQFVGSALREATLGGSSSELWRWLGELAERRAWVALPVPPLRPAEVREWMQAAFGTLRISGEDLRRLHQVTGGNPYYLVEVVRQLVDRGSIRLERDSWTCEPLEQVTLPETVGSAIRAKLEALPDNLRELMQTASVIGDEMCFETLQAVTELEEDRLDALLERAVESRLLSDRDVSRGNDYRFLHPTLGAILYDDLPARRRIRLHGKVVAALERLYAADLERIAAVLAHHHAGVGDWPQTLRWGMRGAEIATAQHDCDRAETCLRFTRRAAAELTHEGRPPADELLARLDLLAGSLGTQLGRLDEAEQTLEEGLRRARAHPQLAAQLQLALAGCVLARGDNERALELACRAESAARGCGSHADEIAARSAQASILTRLDRHEEARKLLESMLAVLSPDDRPGHSTAHRYLAWTALKQGRFGEGRVHAEQALAQARESGDQVAEHLAVSTLAAVLGECGDQEASIPLHERSLELSRRLSLRRREAIDLANLGEAHYRLGRPAQALDHFQEALGIFMEIKDRACEGDCSVNVGRALLALAEPELARTMLERGRALCAQTGRREYEGMAHLYLGERTLAGGRGSEATAAFAVAREIFAETTSHHLWEAELGLARAAHASGDSEAARRHAEAAHQDVERQRAALGRNQESSSFDRSVAAVAELLARLGQDRSSAGAAPGPAEAAQNPERT